LDIKIKSLSPKVSANWKASQFRKIGEIAAFAAFPKKRAPQKNKKTKMGANSSSLFFDLNPDNRHADQEITGGGASANLHLLLLLRISFRPSRSDRCLKSESRGRIDFYFGGLIKFYGLNCC
jgi:hypothetical protein